MTKDLQVTNVRYILGIELRWIALILCCSAQGGLFYAYSAPAAIQNEIQSQYNLNSVQYNMLFSIYNFPAMICPTFAGILCDKYNTGICMVIFVFILNIGQIIFCIGFSIYSFKLMLIGRLILGICGEALIISVAVILGIYFMNKSQSFSYSFCTTISRIFAVLSYQITLKLYNDYNKCISCSIWFGEYVMIFAFICSVGMAYIDYYCYDYSLLNDHVIETKINKPSTSFIESVKDNISICYGLLLILCILEYSCIYPWIAIGSSFMQNTYNYSNSLSTSYLMIPQGIAAICTPFIGILVDKIGHRCHLLIISAILLMFGHGLFLFGCFGESDNKYDNTNNDAIYGLIGLGISFSIFAPIIFTSVNIVLPNKLKGFGIGLMCAMLAFGLFIYPIFVGLFTAKDDDDDIYRYPQLLFFVTACFSLIVCGILSIVDYKEGGKMKRIQVEDILKSIKKVSYGSISSEE